jgi:isoamylase
MIRMGDEMRRTQQGNNDAYCQDGPVSWLDWTLLQRHADVHRFMALLASRRLLRSEEPERRRMSLNELLQHGNRAWHGVKPAQPDWRDCSRSIAFSAELREENLLLYMILNAYWDDLEFELPRPACIAENPWRRWIDTSLPSPDDIVPWQAAPAIESSLYHTEARSVAVFFAAMDAKEYQNTQG